jgi:hypothetical protein
MKEETRDRHRDLLWGLPLSLTSHAVIAALLIHGLPKPFQEPQQEQVINVALVPPAAEPKPKPAPAPSPKAAEAEKHLEPKIQPPSDRNVEERLRRPPQIEVLQPVFQYGEKDAGSKKSLDGDSADDKIPLPTQEDDAKAAAAPEDASVDAAASAGPTNASENSAATASDAEPPQDVEKEATLGEDAGKPDADEQEANATDAGKQPAAASTPLAAVGGDDGTAPPAAAEAPKPSSAKAHKQNFAKASKSGSRSAKKATSKDNAADTARGYSGLPGVRKVRSPRDTGDATVTIAMDGVPRDQRGAKLCATALHRQLADEAYRPDLVPLVPLKAGNVIDAPNAAFSTARDWYGLSFRCEVDEDATRVLSLTFRVGNMIPSGEWARLGLPSVY